MLTFLWVIFGTDIIVKVFSLAGRERLLGESFIAILFEIASTLTYLISCVLESTLGWCEFNIILFVKATLLWSVFCKSIDCCSRVDIRDSSDVFMVAELNVPLFMKAWLKISSCLLEVSISFSVFLTSFIPRKLLLAGVHLSITLIFWLSSYFLYRSSNTVSNSCVLVQSSLELPIFDGATERTISVARSRASFRSCMDLFERFGTFLVSFKDDSLSSLVQLPLVRINNNN